MFSSNYRETSPVAEPIVLYSSTWAHCQTAEQSLFECTAAECDFYSHAVNKTKILGQPAFTCSRLIIETLEQGVKYAQS